MSSEDYKELPMIQKKNTKESNTMNSSLPFLSDSSSEFKIHQRIGYKKPIIMDFNMESDESEEE